MERPVEIRLNAAIVAVTDETPRVLTVQSGLADEAGVSLHALPYGPLDTSADRTLELGLRRWVRERTGLELGYVEQLYTFGDLYREPDAAARVLSVAYLALIRENPPRGGSAWWQDWYKLFPWEDRRLRAPAVIAEQIAPRLEAWTKAAPTPELRMQRHERAAIMFGLDGAPWDGGRALERYELLYEAGLVEEAQRDLCSRGEPCNIRDEDLIPSRSLAFDHRRIAATALSRVRGKISYRPVIFELLPEEFTLSQLQRVAESLAGVRLHKQNFRRLIDRNGLVEGTGRTDLRTGGRPAELFRFRREVLRERPKPGLGLPAMRA